MSKHFSYLVDDESEDFFQKVAFQEAGVVPARAAPPEMKKEASFTSDFEKVASRLDRDLGIIKSAGQCGMNGGMVKRASAYLDHVASNSNLSPEQFGEIFDKVAGEAIQTDLDHCFQHICQDLPDSHHEGVALELAKIGFDAAAEASLVKQASVAALANVLGGAAKYVTGGVGKNVIRGRIGASGAKEVAKVVAKKGAKGTAMAVGAVPYVAGKAGIAGARAAGRGLAHVGRGIASRAKVLHSAVKGGVAAGRKQTADLLKQQGQAAKTVGPQSGAIRQAIAKGAKGSIKKQQAGALNKSLGVKKKVGVPEELAGTTAVGRQSAKASAQAEKNLAQMNSDKAAKAAKSATTPPKVPDAPAGTKPPAGTTNTPKTTVKPAPEGITPPPEVAENPALMETFNKWTSGGKLTAAEAGKLRGTALKGALGYKLMTGKGAVTGGEGII